MTLTKFNTMYDVAFSLEHDKANPKAVDINLILDAMPTRVAALRLNLPKAREAFCVLDTYEVQTIRHAIWIVWLDTAELEAREYGYGTLQEVNAFLDGVRYMIDDDDYKVFQTEAEANAFIAKKEGANV